MTLWQQFVLECYYLIARDRQTGGFAVGRIPWSSIDRFVQSRLERGWIDDDEADDLEALLIALDDDEVKRRVADSEKDKTGGKSPKAEQEGDDDE